MHPYTYIYSYTNILIMLFLYVLYYNHMHKAESEAMAAAAMAATTIVEIAAVAASWLASYRVNTNNIYTSLTFIQYARRMAHIHICAMKSEVLALLTKKMHLIRQFRITYYVSKMLFDYRAAFK